MKATRIDTTSNPRTEAIATEMKPHVSLSGLVAQGQIEAAVLLGTPAAAGSSADHMEVVERRWLMDTGCPYDLTSRENMQPGHECMIEQAEEAIRLNTANGTLDCYDVVDVQIGPLGAEVKP